MYQETQLYRPDDDSGVTADTEILSERGLVRIESLQEGDFVYALNPTTKLVKLKRVTEVDSRSYDGALIAVTTRRCDFRLHPDQQLGYQSRGTQKTVKFQRAGDLLERRHYRFINSWRRPQRPRLDSIDITNLDELGEYRVCITSPNHGHTFRAALPRGCEPVQRTDHVGYYFDSLTFKRYQEALEQLAAEVTISGGNGHHRRPYRFAADDFIQLVGWYVTEGSVSWRTERDSAMVQIAQKTPEHRMAIRELFERLGIDASESEGGYSFGSVLFGRFLEALCGGSCREKHLPEFVWKLPTSQQQLLLDVLQAGDGNERGTYYTASTQLRNDVCRLHFELGIKPRYSRRRDIWQVYPSTQADNFEPIKHLSTVEPDTSTTLYQIGVEDYSMVMAGRNGKFQWIPVGSVS